jgi:hypothetical protein
MTDARASHINAKQGTKLLQHFSQTIATNYTVVTYYTSCASDGRCSVVFMCITVVFIEKHHLIRRQVERSAHVCFSSII